MTTRERPRSRRNSGIATCPNRRRVQSSQIRPHIALTPGGIFLAGWNSAGLSHAAVWSWPICSFGGLACLRVVQFLTSGIAPSSVRQLDSLSHPQPRQEHKHAAPTISVHAREPSDNSPPLCLPQFELHRSAARPRRSPASHACRYTPSIVPTLDQYPLSAAARRARLSQISL